MTWRTLEGSIDPAEPMEPNTIDALLERAAATALTRANVRAVAASAVPAALHEAFAVALQRCGPRAATVLAFALAAVGAAVPREPLLELLADLEDIKHLGPLVSAAEGDRVALLVELVERGRASWEREALALYLATRLLDGSPPSPGLQSHLRMLARQPIQSEARTMLCLALRNSGEPSLLALAARLMPSLTPARHAELNERNASLLPSSALDGLTEREEPRVVSGYTVIRTAPRIGRNDPCHCGSGRKYKRCCADKDQQRGPETPSEILASIGEGHARLRNHLVEQLRPSELARIDPAHVGTRELIGAIRRLSTHRRWDVLALFADELDRRSDLPSPIAGYHDEIAFDALEVGALDVAVRHFELSEPDDEQRAVFELRLALARRSPDALDRLERLAESGLRGNDAGALIEAAHAVLEAHPALGILVARGAISAERDFDSEVLLEAIGEVRDRLLIDPHEPWWGVLDVLAGHHQERERDGAARREEAREEVLWRKEVERVRASQRAAETRAAALQSDLASSRKELERLRAEQERLAAQMAATRAAEPPTRAADLERECLRLRRTVDGLEHAVASGAEQRADLRRELRRVMASNQRAVAAAGSAASRPGPSGGSEDDLEPAAVEAPRRVLVPRYGGAVVKALGELPKTTAAQALRVIAALAGGEALAWAGAKQMRSAADTLSVRVGLSHRVLFRIAGEHLEVVDVVARKDLETALRRR